MATKRTTTKKSAPKKAAPQFVAVERKASKRGRKAIDKPGMDALVSAWSTLEVGATIVLPDNSGDADHAKVTLDRYHFRKRAEKAGLEPGRDYTIESHDEFGATITKLA